MNTIKYAVFSALLLALSGCQAMEQAEKQDDKIASEPLPQAVSDLGYTAKPAIRSITEWGGLYNWQPIDDYSLIIWPNAFKQYLITLKDNCPNLRYAQGIAVTSTNGEIYQNFDSIIVGGGTGAGAQRCLINNIFPLNKTGKK